MLWLIWLAAMRRIPQPPRLIDALRREATTLATLPPRLRHTAATALLRDALGIARLSGKTPRSASEDCSDA